MHNTPEVSDEATSPAALAKRLLNTPISHCFFCHGTGDALDHATLGLGGAIICVNCAVDAAAQAFDRRQVSIVWEEEGSRFPDHPRHIGHDDAGEELFAIEPATKKGCRTTFHHYVLRDQDGYTIGQAGDFSTLRHTAQQLVDGATALTLIER